MQHTKSSTAISAIVLILAAVMAWIGTAQAGTDLSNVAWNQPVTPNAFGGPWYGSAFAENKDGSKTVDKDAARSLINDDLAGGGLSWAYPRSDGGGGWIDLGAEYDIAYIELVPHTPSKWNKLELATVYGSSQKTTDAEYSFIIPDKSSSDITHIEMTDRWRGVRWIRVVDESDVYIGVGDHNFLTMSDIRVVAPVETSSSYIGGVEATATSTHSDALLYSPDHLINNQGMNDQHGPVGQTSAKAAANTGLWMTPNLGAGGFVDQSVTFDLNGVYDLDGMAIWNYNETGWNGDALEYIDYTDRGVKEVLVEYSQDGGNNFIALDDDNGPSEAGNYTVERAKRNNDGSPKANGYSLGVSMSNIVADHVRVTVKGNYGNVAYAGLAEVRFYGDAIVVPGDTNHDGRVDEADARVLADWWGASVTEGDLSKGDFNGDGKVNVLDAAILAANWSAVPGESEGAAVPEPSMLALLIAVAFGGALLRRVR
jgi:hypothetical protein